MTLPSTFRPGRPVTGFLTGDQGLGHLSDQIDMHGIPIRFYHCNQRHHSLALVHVPGITGYHHLMLETTSLDDVGIAFDIEYGYGGAPVSATPPSPRAFTRTSIWGHHFPAEPLPPGIAKPFPEETP